MLRSTPAVNSSSLLFTPEVSARSDAPSLDRADAATISIIIPTLNEQSVIGRTLEQLRDTGVSEVIVADGGSTDRTVRIAGTMGAKLVDAPPGRGVQLNAGAATASGSILLFLHADTLLPERFAHHVITTCAASGVVIGAFQLHIQDGRGGLKLVERCANLRARLLRLPYGDQALFMTRTVFDQLGGFPDTPILEDLVLVRRARKLGRISIAPAAVTTSARRWQRRGIWRTTLVNLGCVFAYFLGVSPRRIARWRG
jgi:rSAM/selenodomain-associated transferase 2